MITKKSSSSLRDVAQAAGVSLGTASRALNNKSNVLPTTRAIVLKAAADLGYKLQIRVPSTVASKLNTVGVAVKRDPGEFPRLDPFNYAVLCGVENECERLSINLMYASLPVNEYSHAVTWSALLESDGIDGLIIVGAVVSDPKIIQRIPRNIPIAVVDGIPVDEDCDTILTHNVRGAYDAVKYLVDNGHTKIGLIGSTIIGHEHPSITERRQGYLKALNDCGIPNIYVEDSHLQGASAYEATLRLLKRVPDITAIFACNDDIAHYVIKAANDLGRFVPDDISVVGFDDTEGALNMQPPLTTMQVDKELMGAVAVRHLYERAINPTRPPITTMISTRLVVRDSVSRV
ncbi:MAG: LacI family DNA-binding transcriptional regulator [Anaerolineae bacterium]